MIKDILKKAATWLAVIFLATDLAYFLAASFLDPRSKMSSRRRHRVRPDCANSSSPFGGPLRNALITLLINFRPSCFLGRPYALISSW